MRSKFIELGTDSVKPKTGTDAEIHNRCCRGWRGIVGAWKIGKKQKKSKFFPLRTGKLGVAGATLGHQVKPSLTQNQICNWELKPNGLVWVWVQNIQNKGCCLDLILCQNRSKPIYKHLLLFLSCSYHPIPKHSSYTRKMGFCWMTSISFDFYTTLNITFF